MNLARLIVAVMTLGVAGCATDGLQAVAPSASPNGASVAAVEIDSSPTTAWIYINGRYVGNTPLIKELAYDSATKYIEVIAEPMPSQPAQARQTQRIQVPPLPTRIHFFMNNHVKFQYDS